MLGRSQRDRVEEACGASGYDGAYGLGGGGGRAVACGEAVQKGGLLYARVGKGAYVFTCYSWFRQLPAGVPGAYRIFANLVSAGR
ncbi:MAG: hypothetical protein QM775_32300 [Pirellulales bacterium]